MLGFVFEPQIQVSLFHLSALGYIGPGSGLAALGAFVALVFALIVAVFGFIWYPIKRLLRKKKRNEADTAKASSTEL